ncbi:hypothetical protein F2Q69_00035781 [Brassica cretica]|uniref:Uncharacterized protein n=1 Tax=Brassica cretica TaxID=69181 RepID=A0A8S9SF40_BRACR|nr:hypothetical protein F2Q69_00035781 [Brassica cretica]
MSNLHQLLQFRERYGHFYWSPAKGYEDHVLECPWCVCTSKGPPSCVDTQQREDYELSSRNLLCMNYNIRDLFREFSAVCKLAGFLKTLEYWPRDKFWDLISGCLILCLEILKTSVLGLGQDRGLITALGGAMTTSTYVSRIVFDLIPSRFKARDMFSAYVTCMEGIEHLFEDNF